MKNCPICNETKPTTSFYKSKSTIDGLQYRCKECITEYLSNRNYTPIYDSIEISCSTCKLSKSKYEFYPDKRQKGGLRPECKSCNRNIVLKRKFNITLNEYNSILISQANKCAICELSNVKFHVDHSHTTSKVRGLLCSNCNTAIGLMKEDKGILTRAIEYLRKNND